MAKINFTSVEKALDINSKKQFIKNIVKLTEKEKKSQEEEEKKIKNKHMGNLVRSLQKDLNRLSKKSDKMWESLGVNKEEISKLIENPGKLSKKDRETIGHLMDRIKKYKKSAGRYIEQEINEDIIQTERKKHVDKRINTNEKWKPI